jgi:hypothetical protein
MDKTIIIKNYGNEIYIHLLVFFNEILATLVILFLCLKMIHFLMHHLMIAHKKYNEKKRNAI